MNEPTTTPADAPDLPAPAATSPPAGGKRYAHPLELGTMGAIVALDQLTKAILRQLLPLGESSSIAK